MSRKITCMILDDEPWAIDLLRSYVEQTDVLTLVYSSTKPLDALGYLLQNEVNLIFLDIQMPGIDGIQVMQQVNNRSKIIITSAYTEYALVGYEHNILDYLLKPISFERFYKSIQKATDFFLKPVSTSPRTFIFIKTESRLVKINIADILFLEGAKDYVFIQTTSERLITLDSLRNLLESLPTEQFERIHKSYIIALEKIDAVEKNRVQMGNYWLPIGDSYKNNLLRKLNI